MVACMADARLFGHIVHSFLPREEDPLLGDVLLEPQRPSLKVAYLSDSSSGSDPNCGISIANDSGLKRSPEVSGKMSHAQDGGGRVGQSVPLALAAPERDRHLRRAQHLQEMSPMG